MGFEQAEIPIERQKEFSQLRGAIERAFAPACVERFFAALKRKNLRIRDFDSLLSGRIFESVDPELKQGGATAQALYGALAVSDQGQVREFYLVQVEQVPGELRHKFHHVYRDS